MSNTAGANSVADAQVCAQAVLDLREMLLRLIKYDGMAKDEATNKLYQKTTDALFAASRIKEGASSVADALTDEQIMNLWGESFWHGETYPEKALHFARAILAANK